MLREVRQRVRDNITNDGREGCQPRWAACRTYALILLQLPLLIFSVLTYYYNGSPTLSSVYLRGFVFFIHIFECLWMTLTSILCVSGPLLESIWHVGSLPNTRIHHQEWLSAMGALKRKLVWLLLTAFLSLDMNASKPSLKSKLKNGPSRWDVSTLHLNLFSLMVQLGRDKQH